jgi:NitT/TauT family transport system ATP-binding protein
MQDELLTLWADTRFTMLFVTHSIEEAIILGSRIVVLSPHPGRVRAVLESRTAAGEALGEPAARALHEEISAMLFSQRFENGGGI